MVGTVYLAPQPGAPPFVKVGDDGDRWQTVCIIEAMKTMNPIAAPRAGRVIARSSCATASRSNSASR